MIQLYASTTGQNTSLNLSTNPISVDQITARAVFIPYEPGLTELPKIYHTPNPKQTV